MKGLLNHPLSIVRLFLCIMLLLSSHYSISSPLPKLGDPSRTSLSELQEVQLGKKFMLLIKHYLPINHDPVINTYIQTLGYRLSSHSTNPSKTFHFFVVNDTSINAFAGPNGYLAVNAGLILSAQSEGELAAVMAHEIAHITQGHIARGISESKKVHASMLAGLLAAALIGTQNANAGFGLLNATTAGGYQHALNFSRQNEAEADRIGLQTLSKAGFDPASMPHFFERLEKHNQINKKTGEISEFLRTHPLTEHRLADIKNRTNQISIKKIKHSNDFPLIQARLAVSLNDTPFAFIRRYSKKINQPIYKKNIRLNYTYALALLQAKKNKQAKTMLDRLIKANPSQILFKMSLADLEQSNNNGEKSLEILSHLYHYQPDYYPLIMQYAKTLIDNDQAKKAKNILHESLDLYTENEDYLRLLSEAEGRSDDKISAYQTRAKICLLNDNKPCAIQQLEMALHFSKQDPYNKRIITSKIETLKKES